MGGRRGACALLLALGLLAPRAGSAAEVEARIARRTLTMGETTALEVTVRGAMTGIQEPQFDVPPEVDVLGSGRSTNFSSINGRNSLSTVFRFELAPSSAGTFRVGPIRVRVGGQVFESPAITIVVSAAAQRVGAGGQGPATLVADVTPREPYVGQPVVLRVRLVQRSRLAEDPRYTPPAATGFWAERASEPESYYADQGGSQVLVTETRTRLYPLAGGTSVIGEAIAVLALALPDPLLDPLQWFRGRLPRREVVVKSPPVPVRVRPLPAGAPAGFDGAVGRFRVSWSADRGRTSQDVPFTARLEVRGPGNIPLLHAPALASPDFEVFSNTLDDSLGAPGTIGAGRRRFLWTVMPRRQGSLELPAPSFVWFDPDAGQYRASDCPPVTIEVGPPLTAGSPVADAFPAVFASHAVDPFRRDSQPWAWALAGMALAWAWKTWRGAARPDPHAAERARIREWMHAVGRGTGSDFWRAADQACGWLDQSGHPVPELRARITASRYGGASATEAEVRPKLLRRLEQSMPPAPRRGNRWMALPLALGAVVLCVGFGPRSGDPRAVARVRAGDQAARGGDLERARREWMTLWRAGARDPGLAARLAWIEVRSGAVGPAASWVLRGEQDEPRDPALEWATGQVRDAGGLTGFRSQRLPVRPLEWSVLALLFGALAFALWPRRALAAGAAALMVLCVAIWPVQGWRAAREPRGVVSASVPLEGTDLELEPGQVVTVLERAGDRVRAAAGRGVIGWLPRQALQILEPPR